jgi:putative ABC transport system substrate-binding protein
MEFAREIVQGATRIGVLTDLKDPKAPPQMQELQAAGRDLKVDVIDAGVRQPDEIDSALQSLANQRVDIVIVLQTSMLLGERRQIAALALAKRLPTIFGYREHILAGGLLSYGVDLRWCFQRGAFFVDKILHGTPAGDLPIEFPTKMFLAINVKTAKALGVTPSATLLSRADEVIE